MVKHRKMKGGFLDSLSSWASNTWNKTKAATTNAYNSAASSFKSTPTTTTYQSTTPTYGGKKRSRKMRGGYSDNIALTGLAANAAPITDIKSAQPLTVVGGKRRKTRKSHHRRGKTHKHRKH